MLIGFVEDLELAFVVGALATPEKPAGDDGVCHQRRVFGSDWFVCFKRFGEIFVEILRLLTGDEHHARAAAVFETVQAGERGGGEMTLRREIVGAVDLEFRWLIVDIFVLQGNLFRFKVGTGSRSAKLKNACRVLIIREI